MDYIPVESVTDRCLNRAFSCSNEHKVLYGTTEDIPVCTDISSQMICACDSPLPIVVQKDWPVK